jgi:hypothetical protein
LVAGLADLERRTRAKAGAPTAPRPCVARLILDEKPPAFFYAEGRGLDAVPSGLAVPLSFSSGARRNGR